MIASPNTAKWLRLKSPATKADNIRVNNISGNAFVVICDRSIFKYNVHTNTFFKYPNNSSLTYNCSLFDVCCAVNKTEHIIYFYSGSQIEAIHLNTNQYEIFEHIPRGMSFCFINNNFHIITAHDKQWIGTISNNSINCLHDSLSNRDSMDVRRICPIYLPSKQSVLILGGYYDYAQSECHKKLWLYSLATQKWTQIDKVMFEGFLFGAVLTSNEKYIVLFGGYNDDKAFDDSVDTISVLDMTDDNNWKIRKSNIVCPCAGPCYATKTGGVGSNNKQLVIGYVKKCFKMKGFECMNIPPIYIMILIYKWYDAEMIHWLEGDKHYGIYLKDILSSLND
eukprot:2093_1